MRKLYLAGIVFLISLLAVSAGDFPDEDMDGFCETPFCDKLDNCPKVACEQLELPIEDCIDPALNKDSDGDGAGDGCDECPNDPLRFEEPCTPPPRRPGGGGGGGGTEGGPCCGACEHNSAMQCRVNPYSGDCTVIDNIRCAAPTPARPPVVGPASTAPVQILARPPSEGAVQQQPVQRAAFAPPQGPRVGKAVSNETAGGTSAVIIPLLVLLGIAVVAYLLFRRKASR